MTELSDQDPQSVRDYYDTNQFPLSALRRVPMNRPGQAQEAFALRLPPSVVEELRQRAAARGMGVTQLVRDWVIDRLELERRRPDVTDPVLWERTRMAVDELLPEIFTRVAARSETE